MVKVKLHFNIFFFFLLGEGGGGKVQFFSLSQMIFSFTRKRK